MTDAKTIREVVNEKELVSLGGMYNKEFAASHPEFVEHFAEYNPARVPRMLSRASHVDNMADPTLESITEATQIGAGEFYQIMSEGFQFNYPVTTGLMPWVYKRPWPVVAAINLVDGYGQPSAPYYFLKRTYDPTRVALDLKRLLWAPGEKFPVVVKVINGVDQPAFNGHIKVQILDSGFKESWKKQVPVSIKEGTSVSSVDLESFGITADYKEKYFFVIVRLYNEANRLISSAEYWPRTIRLMEDPEYFNKYCSEPVIWPTLEQGPWLKPTVSGNKTSIEVSRTQVREFSGKTGSLSFVVKNTGNKPAFMVHFEIEGCKRAFFVNDNYFWLALGESKLIEMEVLIREERPVKQFDLVVKAWNTKSQKETVGL
jgi:beta-mannosidase